MLFGVSMTDILHIEVFIGRTHTHTDRQTWSSQYLATPSGITGTLNTHMSGTLVFSHNSQNMTYFVTKFGMCKFCVVCGPSNVKIPLYVRR